MYENLNDLAIDMRQTAYDLRATIHNNIFCRKHHPSYGYTKRDARDHLQRLVGVLYALAMTETGEHSANITDQAMRMGTRMGIDVLDLQQSIYDS